jgi:hypothetical protein
MRTHVYCLYVHKQDLDACIVPEVQSCINLFVVYLDLLLVTGLRCGL